MTRDAKWESEMRERVRLGDQARLVLHDYYEEQARPADAGMEIANVQLTRSQQSRMAYGEDGPIGIQRGAMAYEILISALGSLDSIHDFVGLLREWNQDRQQDRAATTKAMPPSFRQRVIAALDDRRDNVYAAAMLRALLNGAPLLDLIANVLPELLDERTRLMGIATKRMERECTPMTVMVPERPSDHLASCDCNMCKFKRAL